MREHARERRIGGVSDMDFLAGGEGDQARGCARRHVLDPLVLHLSDQGGGDLAPFDSAPDHAAIVAARDDPDPAGVNGRRQDGAAKRTAMRLDGDESLLGLQTNRAVAQREHGAAGAIEQGVGDEGVERKDHAREIRHSGRDDQTLSGSATFARHANPSASRRPFERRSAKKSQKGGCYCDPSSGFTSAPVCARRGEVTTFQACATRAAFWETVQAMAAKLAGGGGGRYDLGQNSEINVTPFVDILLVLLIIFMVAVPMAVTSIKIDLPPAVPPPPNAPKPKEPVFISIQKSGAIFIADKQSSLDNLEYDLNAKFTATGQAGPKDDQRIMIRADADVLYADFMGVLNQLQTSGWFKVGLINEDIH